MSYKVTELQSNSTGSGSGEWKRRDAWWVTKWQSNKVTLNLQSVQLNP